MNSHASPAALWTLIPAYNAQATIAAVVEQARRHLAAVDAAVVADRHKRGERQAQRLRLYAQREAPDHAALHQLAHPLVHGGRGKPHLVADVGVGTSAV